jgi:hypothetical protein
MAGTVPHLAAPSGPKSGHVVRLKQVSTRLGIAVFALAALSLAGMPSASADPAFREVQDPGKACAALLETVPGSPGRALQRGAVVQRDYVSAMCTTGNGIVYHESCEDGIDNDSNGLTDLDDPACAHGGPEG